MNTGESLGRPAGLIQSVDFVARRQISADFYDLCDSRQGRNS